jgi:two-component system, sensor histidine kinase LadS
MILFDNWKNKNKNLGYSNYTHWLKFKINKKLNSNMNYFLLLENHKIEELDLFFVENGEIISSFKDGMKESKKQNIFYRKYVFPLPNNYNELEVYVKIKNNFYPLNLDFLLLTDYSLEAFINIDNYTITTGYLLLLTLFILHILIFSISKISFYRYYLVYLFLVIIVGLFNSGILNLYLFKDGVNDFIIILFRLLGFFMVIYLIKLIKNILNLEENQILSTFINTLIISLFLTLTISDLSSLLGYKLFLIYLSDIIFILLFLSILIILIYKSFKKSFISKLLILIWLPLFSIIIIYTINSYYTFINTILLEYVVKFLFIYESIFISLIIAYKYNLIEREKESLIIESKNKEIEYLRKSKLVKMGEMLNNIAHQWKQPLARINSIVFKSYDLIDENKKEDLKNELLLIENETLNMSNTISSLLSFFHVDKKEEIFNLYDLAIKQKNFIEQLDSSIYFKINCLDNTIMTSGYKNEYEQVVRVIIENAFDSFKESNIQRKNITISIKERNDIPIFTIGNTGENIKEEFLDKIFEPYFTTKDKEKHQGIGLYMSKMLIEDSMNKKLKVVNTTTGVKFIIKG